MKNIFIAFVILFVSCSSDKKGKNNNLVHDSVIQVNEPKEKLINKDVIQKNNTVFDNKVIDTIPPKKNT
jgi:hypothetical protein